MGAEKKTRIGIVGTGGIANAHMKYYITFDDVEIVGACDIVPGKAREFLDRYGLDKVPAFEDLAEMIEQIPMDGASVCTYHRTHASCSIALMEAGIHVLCEKPMSFTLQEAADMVRVSRQAKKILTIGFQPRFSYMRQKVDDFIRSGALGKVYYVEGGDGRRRGLSVGNFIRKETAGYGVIGDTGCYVVDQCMHAINYPRPLTASAMTSCHFGRNPKYSEFADIYEVEDFATAYIRLEGDITYVFKQAWAMHFDRLGDTYWLGTEGSIRLKGGFKEHNTPSDVIFYTDVNGLHADSFLLPSKPFDAYGDNIEVDSWREKMRTFADAVLTNGPAPVPCEEILYNQAILDGIYRSAQLGKEVDIVIPDV